MRKRKKSFGCFFSLIKFFLVVTLLAGLYLSYQTYSTIKQVETYRSQVEELAQKYNIPGYETLVLAIIYTESKGEGTDLMQSSESLSGEQESITTQAGSLDQGVLYLSNGIQLADSSGDNLATAIQAYNFGHDYINYVAVNGGTSTVEVAETYSRDVLAPLLGNTEGTQYRYWNFQAILYNGGYLYNNGGNFFYAEIVQWNQKLIEFYEKVFGTK